MFGLEHTKVSRSSISFVHLLSHLNLKIWKKYRNKMAHTPTPTQMLIQYCITLQCTYIIANLKQQQQLTRSQILFNILRMQPTQVIPDFLSQLTSVEIPCIIATVFKWMWGTVVGVTDSIQFFNKKLTFSEMWNYLHSIWNWHEICINTSAIKPEFLKIFLNIKHTFWDKKIMHGYKRLLGLWRYYYWHYRYHI